MNGQHLFKQKISQKDITNFNVGKIDLFGYTE